ncbi:hypothetical protein [uncultured Legionella sp.]|uniref:hypothetical protein n=1 Tax=uncultured Legionella sp. TaxID=210934 RepID=UPI0026072037|nr:hypothetical protein [uncultured Legionella sp.]
MIISKDEHKYSLGYQGNTFSLEQIASIIWQDEPEPFFTAISDIGFTPSFFAHRGDFNSAGNRLDFYSKKAHDSSLLEQDFIGFLPALITLKRVNLFTAVVKAYLFLYQNVQVNELGVPLEGPHYLSFDVFLT